MSEREKEKYFESGIISYIGSSNNNEMNIRSLNNIFERNYLENNKNEINYSINNYNHRNFVIVNNSIQNLNINVITNSEQPKLLSITRIEKSQFNEKTESDSVESQELPELFSNSITRILKVRTFFFNNKGKYLRKMELDCFKNDLAINGIDINELLKGCLDSLSDILI